MSTITDNDLKELKDLIISGQTEIKSSLKEIEKRLTSLEIEVASVKGEIKTLDEKLTGKINALDERVAGNIKVVNERTAGIDKRLDNQEFVSRGILIALVVAILGGFAKLFGLIGNP